MATRKFVNLAPYEAASLAQRANQVSPLDALISGAQQGLQLQQLPQQLQDQALARQLNNLLTQQKIQDLQNPQAALARKLEEELTLKGALNPNLGIQRAAPGLVGETIYNPGALTPEQNALQLTQPAQVSPELQAMRQYAADQGGVPLPPTIPQQTAQARLPETPISAFGIETGLNINPNVPIQAEADKLNRDLTLANARRSSVAPRALRFETIGNSLVGLDVLTGAEVSRIPIDPKKERFNTTQGVYEFDPANPNGGRILPGTEPSQQKSTSKTMQGFDTKTGLYGLFSPDDDGTFAEGIVPASQAPKSAPTKPLPITQSDQFTGLNLLDKRLDEIEKSPKSLRKSNVGWIDSAIGYLQGVTGAGDSVGKNDAFRTAVDSLIGEFSFGRGGKALTVNEKEVLAKYLPSLIQSDETFESRLGSFRKLVQELREARIDSLSNSGYDVSKFSKDQASNTPQEFKTLAEAEKANLPKGTKITVGGRPAEVQ